MNNTPILYTEEQEKEIQTFILLNFGESEFTSHELESEYVHTDTALIAPEGQTRTFVTFGMGARQMNSPSNVRRIELAISASPDMDVCSEKAFWLAGEITHLSKFPFREDTWLEAGHTIGTSLDFEERFGYEYFALWDLDLSFRPTGMDEDVHFFALVPIYEAEREWIVENNTLAFMYHLYDAYGDAMFHADRPRQICIPDWDEEEQSAQLLMRFLGLNEETMAALLERMEEAEKNGEEITYEQLGMWVQELQK